MTTRQMGHGDEIYQQWVPSPWQRDLHRIFFIKILQGVSQANLKVTG